MQYLGKALDSFTMMNIYRVILLDADISKTVPIGSSVLVKLKSGKELNLKVIDGILEQGEKFNKPGKTLSAIKVENAPFSNEDTTDCEMFLP